MCYTGWKFTNISKDTGNYELKVEHVEVQQSKHNTLGPLQLLWDRLIQFKHRITLSGASFTPREIVQYGNIVIYYIVIYHMLTLTVWCGFRTINPWIANSFTIGNLRPFSTSHYNHSTYEGSPFFFFFSLQGFLSGIPKAYFQGELTVISILCSLSPFSVHAQYVRKSRFKLVANISFPIYQNQKVGNQWEAKWYIG